MNLNERIDSLLKEYQEIYGHKSPEFKRGWKEAVKYKAQKDLDEYLDELYNDVEQGKFEKDNGGLNE